MGYTKDQLLSSLQELQISFSKYEHPVVLTVEAQAKYVGHVKAALSKNLFLKDKKQRFYIVSALADTKVDLKVLSQRLGLGKGGVRMAPEESLADILQVPVGCVTPFALVNESARNVSLLLDQGFKSHDSCIFHPLSNDMSIALNAQDLDKFLHSIGIRPAYVDLKDNPAVGKDQPPDLASLVPSDATVLHAPPQSKASVQVPTENQILSNANTAPVAKAETTKPSRASMNVKSSGATDLSISFADADKFVDEILEKTKSIVLSQVKGDNLDKHITQLGLEMKNIAIIFKNTAYTEGFMAGKMAVISKLKN